MALIDKLTELAKVVSDQAAELAKNASEIGGELAKNVADKTNDLLETGKLNGQISSANTSINELKTRLGDHYWNLYVQGEQLDDDAVVLCTTIKEYTEEIANLQAQLADLKAKREAAVGKACQACGTVNNLDACFCKNCGVKLEVVDVEVEPAEEKKCCCGHHEGEEHKCCCHAEADEEETVIEIAQNKVCPNCQAENDPEHTFCNKCGAKL